jgi:uncharacterized membrane protein YbhN (UPF0104 family)
MQVNLKKPPTRRLGLLLKAAVGVVVVGTVWYTLHQQRQGLGDIFREFRTAFAPGNAARLALVLALTALNWSLEARKWQALARRIEPISFGAALRGVLAGLTIGFVSQVNAGDFLGKVGSLRSDRRLEALGAVLLGSGVQTFVTLAFGTLAYAVFLSRVPEPLDGGYLAVLGLLVGTLAFSGWLYARRDRFEYWLARFDWLRRFSRNFHVLQTYAPGEVARVLGWATLRHLTFSLQFLLVLRVFGVTISLLDAWTVVNLVFLAKTFIPAFHFLSDLGVREFSALYFFGFFGVPAARVVSATLALWLANVLLPVLVGSAFVFQLRLTRRTR